MRAGSAGNGNGGTTVGRATRGVLALALGSMVALGITAVNSGAKSAPAQPTDPVERGRYLVTVIGCGDCHTPVSAGFGGPEPDMSRYLSGHPEHVKMPKPVAVEGPWMMVATNTAFAGPWGISYAANLTPDSSGLAAWDEEIFVQALRTGRHWGTSRPIMPPMPWQFYRNLTDEDLRAVFAYLRTIPPVRNHVPEYEPPPEAR